MIKRDVREVYLTYDSDEAGTKAALRAIPIMKEAGIAAKVIRMDPYKDPDEFIKALGAEAFEERIGKARNGFLFSLEMLEREYDMDSPEGKTAFLHEVARRLVAFEEELERNNYIEAAARQYHISFESLQNLVSKTAVNIGLAKPVTRPKSTMNREKQKEDGSLKSQKILLTWLVDDESLFSVVSKYIRPQDFTTSLYREVAEILYGQYEQGSVNPAKIMNHFTEEEQHHEVASLFHTKIQELTTKEEQEKALKETIIRVKSQSIEAATKALEPTDMEGPQCLMKDKRALDELRNLHISID